jgi:dienelactone hydrolase
MRLICSMLLLAAAVSGQSSAIAGESGSIELVRFESAPQPLGDLQQKQARARGEEPRPIPGDMIQGYLARPEGDGPFPAVVYLHGCSGLSATFKADPTKNERVSQLVEWGYVVLVVDSFSTRGVKEACTPASYSNSSILTRELDAFGALQFLSHLTYVDRNRVAMLGFSMGGWTALAAGSKRSFELFQNPEQLNFKAAVAFYPACSPVDGVMEVPTLILTGASDDWSPAKDCERMMRRRDGAGAPVDLVIYPNAYHAFDLSVLQPGRSYFGHWVEYNAEADRKAWAATRAFLTRQLRP